MSLIAQKISGCYRRVLIFLFISIIVCAGLGVLAYNLLGGAEGLRYWTATRALNGTEKHLLTHRPDGIPQESVIEQFETVRQAIRIREIDLDSLYQLIKSYQDKFYIPGLSVKIKPSTPEIEEFLLQLNQTIISEE